MLSALRDNVGGWVAKIFIGLLALSFAVWGINDVFTGSPGDALVTVGEKEVSAADFQNAFRARVNSYSRQSGRQLTNAEARAFGVDREVLGELIRNAALDNQIGKLGLALPVETVAQQIADNPLFHNAQGQFDRARFQQLLQRNNMDEATFVLEQRDAVLRQEVAGVIDQSLSVPTTMVKALVKQQSETRVARYFVLTAEDTAEIPEPTEAEQKEYYEANKRSFTAPEFRTLTLLRLEPEDIADTIEIAEEEVRQIYDQRISDYRTPETREIQQITFPSVEEAKAAREKILAGTDFLDVARERGLKAIDYNLGEVQKSELPDDKLAEAAFSLPEGEISAPVEGKLSVALLRVLAIKPEVTRSFEEVREEIKKQLSLERAQEEILNLHDAVEDARAGGATLDEIGAKFDLPVFKVDAVDRSGNGPDGKPLSDIPASASVLTTAYESDVGVENDPVDTENEGFVWVDVTDITPSAVKPLEEVTEQVVELWKTDKTRELLGKKAEELVEQSKAGKSIDDLATALEKTVTQTEPLKRREKADPFGTAAVRALFRTPEGQIGLGQSSEPSKLVVFKVEKVDTPVFDASSEESKAISEQLTTGVGEDLFQIYVSGLQESLGVEINDRLWSSLQSDEYQPGR